MLFMKKFRSKISRFMFAIFTLNILSGLLPANLLTAAASSITFPFITGIVLADETGQPFTGEIQKDSKLRITYKWAIPDTEDVYGGDTYELTIPEEIKILEDVSIPLKDGSGTVLANVQVNTDNTVVITFTSEVETLSSVSGNFYVYSEFDETQIGDQGETQIVFDLGAGYTETLTVTFVKEPEDTTQNLGINLLKTGSYNTQTNVITWKITAKPESKPDSVPVSNARISDTIPEGLSYIDGSAEVKAVSGSAIVATGGAIVWDAASNTLSYNFDSDINTSPGEVYYFEFKTQVDQSVFNSEDETVQFKNKAKAVYDGGSTLSNEAVVSTTVDYIDKSGAYNTAGRKIDWTITVNNNYLTLSDPVITDKIPKGLTLIEDSVKLDGAAVSIDNTNGPLKYDHTDESNQLLTYDFLGGIEESHVLTYSTYVTDPDAYNSNEMKTYTNSAVLTGTDIPANAKTGVGVGVPTNIITKEGAGYNKSTHRISWSIVVNSNSISIEDGEVSDNIPAGLVYVPGSFKVDDSVPSAGFTYTEAGSSDTTKTGSFTYILGDISESHILTYQTEVLSNSVYAVNGSRTFYNTATLTGSNIPGSSSTGSQTYTSKVIEKTGVDYDYITREATWKIVVNQNNMQMDHAFVTDSIGNYQEFVPGSVTINGVPAALGSSAAELNSYYYNDTTGTLSYRFPAEINTSQTITFKTKIADLSIFDTNGEKKIYNTAKLSGDDIPSNVQSKGEIAVSNVLISKTHSYTGGSTYIPWKVVVNVNQLPIENAVLVDDLQEGLSLDTESVRLFELNVADDGSYTQGEEVALDAGNVKYDGAARHFEFTFKGSIQKAYMLTFNTDIDDAYNNAVFSNTIHFKGSHGEETGTSSTIAVSFQTAGGGATGTNGSVSVIKVDENTSQPLAGAVFELLDKNGNVLKTSGVTGEDGKALFDKLKFRTYYIREKTAPTGYVKSDTLYPFTLINETDKKDITLYLDNSKIKGNIEFKKVTENGNPLAGAVFALYSASDASLSNPLATAVSGEDGAVRFENVEYGNYQIAEISAPAGYQLTKVILSASITENGVTVKVNPENISNIIIKGDINILKKDADTGSYLAGAKFALYDEDNNFIGEKETDEAGTAVFNDIPYGKYYLTESKAPDGYQLSAEKYSITVDSIDEQTVEINDEALRSLVIEKSDTANPALMLSGAEFEIKDAAGQLVGKVVTDTAGRAEWNGLAFGKYTVTEVQAPNNYNIDNKSMEIEITKENTPAYVYTLKVTDTKKTSSSGGGSTPGTSGSGTPATPVTPAAPDSPATPGTPANPDSPVNPGSGENSSNPGKQDESTPKNTPVDGKVDVPEGGSAQIKKQPEHGNASVDEDGRWIYKPDKDYVGDDEFIITVTDAAGKEKDIYIDIDVDAVPLGDVDTGTDSTSGNKDGQTLPKTGENSRLPQYLAGVLLLGMGLILGKKQWIKK